MRVRLKNLLDIDLAVGFDEGQLVDVELKDDGGICVNEMYYFNDQQYDIVRDDRYCFATSCTFESDKYCFEAIRLDDYPDVAFIRFTNKRDKRRSDRTTDVWDNEEWMRQVLNGCSDSISELKKDLCSEGVKDFIDMLHMLKDRGWL